MHPAPLAPSHAPPTTRLEHVEIRARKIVEDDEVATILTVHCPERRRSVRLEDCLSCSHCKGLHLDPESDHSFLVCEVRETGGGSCADLPLPVPEHRSATATSIGEIMSREVVCVTPDLEATTLAELFLERGFSGAPVVDDRGQPIGIVSKTDLLRACYDPAAAGREVAGAPRALDPGAAPSGAAST
jgi:hypothetical protein